MQQLSLAGIVVSLLAALGALGAIERSRAGSPPARPPRLTESPVLARLQPNPLAHAPRNAAEQTLAQMYLEPGFRAELIAAEPELQQPIAFTFDERGRLWVAEAYSYPQKRPAGQGLDRIVIFEDRAGDGTFKTRKIFAEGLNLVSGLAVGFGGVWVGAAPELLFIPDRDGDDHPDGPPEVLLDGFGFQDTHETLNNFTWGPDGWLYGNQGVFNYARIGKPGAPERARVEMRAGVWRFHPIRRQFEIFAQGGSNQWGLDFDEHGQLFMTTCRSFFGQGAVTHVIQGGIYWNQANQNYPPYVSATAPAAFPFFRNYLLASARHDHGEGGAGLPGTTKIYGGHAHVGTMVYLGDNWPDTYRNQLFTHNLHGHQINHEFNQRLGSGFDTVHAETDFFYCADPTYVAVDLKEGPDGAVYIIDWSDRQHCHNPNTESWDRSTGRIYRIIYEKTYRPVRIDLRTKSDAELVELQLHHNDWFVRTARRLLQERAFARKIDPAIADRLRNLAERHPDPARRLRALWALHAVQGLSDDAAERTLADPDEYVRAWTVQFLAERQHASPRLASPLVKMAASDPSPVVRLYLASAVQRVSTELAWPLIEGLAGHSEDIRDRNLPLMIWFGLAQQMSGHLERAFALSSNTRISVLADYIHWYAAKLGGPGLDRVLSSFADQSADRQRVTLAGISLAMSGRANVPQPRQWKSISGPLYSSSDREMRHEAERLAAVFGDRSVFPRLRRALANPEVGSAERQHAFDVLSEARDPESLPLFLALLDEPVFRPKTIALLGHFEDAGLSDSLLKRYSFLNREEKAAALNAMTSRVSLALPLLRAVASEKVNRNDLTAFQIRQLAQLGNPEINRQLAEHWGKLQSSSADKQAQIQRLEKIFTQAPLWAYSQTDGAQHFQKLCASCHRIKDQGNRVGPELTGAGANGIRYFLENIIDPNAVIGQNYQLWIVRTRDEEIISGLLEKETSDALTLRNANGPVVIPKGDIAERRPSDLSLMPEGLLDNLKEREQIELLKFLTAN